MTLDEIQCALTDAMETGKLGTPVAARVHLLVNENDVDAAGAAERIVAILTPCFDQPPTTIRARRHSSGRVNSLLLKTESGRTVFITVGLTSRPALHLLVVGNHGIVRLEGGEFFATGKFGQSPGNWSAMIAESCETGRECRLD